VCVCVCVILGPCTDARDALLGSPGGVGFAFAQVSGSTRRKGARSLLKSFEPGDKSPPCCDLAASAPPRKIQEIISASRDLARAEVLR
jgi:hypothetical protein